MVVEEYILTGREVSVLSFVDGKHIKSMTSAQDHKRLRRGQGPEYGRHGNIFSLLRSYTKEVDEISVNNISISPLWMPWREEGREFKGNYFLRPRLRERPQGAGIQCKIRGS